MYVSHLQKTNISRTFAEHYNKKRTLGSMRLQ